MRGEEMRLALIASDGFESRDSKGEALSLNERMLAAAWEKASVDQTLALAKFLQDGSHFEPCLICREGSYLAKEAGRLSLPHLCLRTGRNMTDRFRLWRWQRQSPAMLVLSLGLPAMRVGGLLHRMRKKNSTVLVCAFLLQPPAVTRKDVKILSRASLLICGSEYIVERLALDMEKNVGLSWPGSVVIAPGIECQSYVKAAPWQEKDGKNFVFGIAESMTPRSGAILIIRAMSALWQKEDLPPFEVRMFGAGSRFDEVLEEASNLGVKSRLSILSEQELSRVAGSCNAWIAPGSGHVEMPATLWAGFAARLPVICGQSQLHMERLEGSQPFTAIKVELNDPQKMARAMISVMSDSKLRAMLIRNGESMLDQASLNRMSREVIEVLESILLAKPGKTPPGSPACQENEKLGNE